MAGKKYRLDDDGTLTAPGGGSIAASDIEDIDMSKWMSKSIATIKVRGGRTVVLDDYKFRNSHLIVGAIASRIYPDAWTSDARDLAKIRAQEAESAGEVTNGPEVDAAKADSGTKA